MTDSDQPLSPAKLFIEKLKAYQGVILAIAALVAAVSSWFKPTDTTATKNSFEHTSEKIETLSANDVQLREDIIAIRSFLEGYVKSNQAPAVPSVAPANGPTEGTGLGSGFGRGSGRLGGSSRPRRAPTGASMDAADPVVSDSPPAPMMELPPLAEAPQVIKAEKFEDIVFESKK